LEISFDFALLEVPIEAAFSLDRIFVEKSTGAMKVLFTGRFASSVGQVLIK